MFKTLLLVPAVAAVAIAATEVTFRLRPEMPHEAQAHVMRMALGAQCPDKPDALQIATADAYQYSLRHPVGLPPWQVFMISRKMQVHRSSVAENMFATGFCKRIIAGEI